ncbi:MAG TPA: glycosyltransferase 87 family protein [Gemmataceae bacterium]|nr:glycosyltransferase 87 family protein [Gemmataceae bacterium]
MPTTAAELPQYTGREMMQGAFRRLVLPFAAFVLLLWNLCFLLNSWILLPQNDFGRMLASASLFLEGKDMYAATPATAAWLEEDYSIALYNMNPPHFHLLLLPLALLSDLDEAFVLWWVLGGVCLLQCSRWILAETGLKLTADLRRSALLMLLAFCGTAAMLFTGQLTFLLLVPVTLMWRSARRGHWGRSGAWLGLALSVKPFLAVLLAYFLWRRRWRAAASCLVACAFCFAVGLLVFGGDNHVSWRGRLAISEGWAWLPMNASLMGMLTRLFTESVWYTPLAILPTGLVWLLWVGIGGALAVLTLAATGRGDTPAGVDQDFCLVLLASVLFCPLGWVYYLWLALPPLVALLARGWADPARRPRRRWLWAVMLLAFIWPPTMTRLLQPEAIGPRRSADLPPIGAGWPVPLEAAATVVLGNVYCWGLLALWARLVGSGLALKHHECAAAAALAPLDPADYRVSVVMPVYSETDTVLEIATWLTRELGPRLEEIIIVQSPRSSERSRTVCQDLAAVNCRVRLQVQQNNPGLGRAVRQGFAQVRGNVVLTIDSDGEMAIETVPRLLAEMAQGGHGLVIASRWLRGGGFTGYSPMKYYLNWCFQQLFRCLFWTRLHDLTYGFKVIRAELVRGLDWEGTLHEIACETTLKPVRLGVSVAEVPSRWTARTQGASKNTFWRNFRYVRTALTILVRGVGLSERQGSGTTDEEHPSQADVVTLGVAEPAATT